MAWLCTDTGTSVLAFKTCWAENNSVLPKLRHLVHKSVEHFVMNWKWHYCNIYNNMEIVQYGVRNLCRIYKMSWFSHTLWKRENNFKCKGYGNSVNKHQCIRGFFMQQARFILHRKKNIYKHQWLQLHEEVWVCKKTYFSIDLHFFKFKQLNIRRSKIWFISRLYQFHPGHLLRFEKSCAVNTRVSENQVHFSVWDQRFNSVFLNRQNEPELSKHSVHFGQ